MDTNQLAQKKIYMWCVVFKKVFKQKLNLEICEDQKKKKIRQRKSAMQLWLVVLPKKLPQTFGNFVATT